MEMNEAYRRQRLWGDRTCEHPSAEREYYLGAHTGDYVCPVCGRGVDPDESESRLV